MAKASEIEARIKRIEEQLKAARGDRAKAKTRERKEGEKVQNKKDILYAIFCRTVRPEIYERDIKSPEFDRFIVRDYERAYFGLPVAGAGQDGGHETADALEENKEPEPKEKRLYLSVEYHEKDRAKKIAKEIYGEGYRSVLDFDKSRRQWFLRGDADPAPFAEWLPVSSEEGAEVAGQTPASPT